MSKILAVSDIHIHDYPQRNYSEKIRLYQSRTVCQNIIDAGKREGAEILVIAGDIMEKFLIRPYVQAEIKLFLDTLAQNFPTIYIIFGNHDQDAKSSDVQFTDSCLAVMLPPNVYYADMKEVNIDGCRIGFYNWRPKFDLSWINGKLDVLFTHATIAYTDDECLFSQELDESKFDLAICGDIHKPATKGKYVSIGIPQKCKMSDSDICSGVIYDTADKSYRWVDLNPSDNLIKFVYTENREEEGWDEASYTWRVYKPSNQSISGGVKDIKVPAWEEVGNLVTSVISGNNLMPVHSEVLSNIKDLDAKEVDFNFVITRFYCKNWRSIDEVELFFEDMDRVLITGNNGSGKSSLLSAIKYAFLENPHPKDLIQFGTNECWTEVEFTYQGNQYKIQRGSGKYGFWINGEQQKYNGKKQFEADMHVRFPFIDYMDVYFFDSDHSRLIGDITPERKSEIISRFYKMDRIDAYNEEAKILLDKYIKSTSSWQEEIDKATEVNRYIEDRLQNLVLPAMTETDLNKKREEGVLIQKAWIEYNKYMTNTANYQAAKSTREEKLKELQKEVAGFRNQAEIQAEIEQLKAQSAVIGQLNTRLMGIKTEGRRLFNDRKNLDVKKICSSCGQEIKVEHLEQHKQELTTKINELLKEQEAAYQDFFNIGITDKEEIDGGCAKTMQSYNTQISNKMYEISVQTKTLSDIETYKRDLKTIEASIQALGQQPPKIELPDGFMEQMGQVEADLGVWKQYHDLIRDKAATEETIERCKAEMSSMSATIDAYQAYIKLTGPTGLIYKEIMSKLAEQFSDNKVKYTVIQTEGRGNRKDHLNLESSYILNGGNEVRYVNCSAGQRTFLDVDFLSKVVTRMGLLIMDEFLKHLDAENHDVILDIIGQMNTGLTLISSHMESIPAFNNKALQLELNESGITKITVK